MLRIRRIPYPQQIRRSPTIRHARAGFHFFRNMNNQHVQMKARANICIIFWYPTKCVLLCISTSEHMLRMHSHGRKTLKIFGTLSIHTSTKRQIISFGQARRQRQNPGPSLRSNDKNCALSGLGSSKSPSPDFDLGPWPVPSLNL